MGDNVGALKTAVLTFLKERGCATLNEMRRWLKVDSCKERDFARAISALLLDDYAICYVKPARWASGDSPLYTLR